MVAHRTATLIMRQIFLKLAQTRDLGMSSRPAIPDCYQKFVLSYMIAHLGRSTLSLPPSRWQLKIAKTSSDALTQLISKVHNDTSNNSF